MKYRIPPLLAKELEPLKGRWKLRKGTKHYHLTVDGDLVAVLPRGRVVDGVACRQLMNTRAAIRRYLARISV